MNIIPIQLMSIIYLWHYSIDILADVLLVVDVGEMKRRGNGGSRGRGKGEGGG